MPKNCKCKFRNNLNKLWLSMFGYGFFVEPKITNHLVKENQLYV